MGSSKFSGNRPTTVSDAFKGTKIGVYVSNVYIVHCTIKQAHAVKLRKIQKNRAIIPKGPIFSMNLVSSIWL